MLAPLLSKIRWRLISYYLAVIAVVVLMMGGFFIWYLNYFYRANLQEHLLTQTRLTAALLEEASAGYSAPGDLDALCKKLGDDLGLRLTVVAADGEVVGDSDEIPALMDNHLERPEIREAMQYGQGASTRYSTTLGQEMLYVAVPVRLNAGKPGSVGIARLSLSLSQVEAAVLQMRLFIMGALMVSTVLALLLGMRLSLKITDPLNQISGAARAIAGGDFEPHLEVAGRDEMAGLARTIREMGRSLRKQVQKIVLEKNKLDTVISSMNSGIVLVDRSLKIEMVNPAAEEIFGITRREAVGLPVHVALRYFALLDNIKAACQDGEPRHFEIYLYYPQAMTLQTFLVPVTGARGDVMGVLALFHDITSLRSVEKMRSEFVANVSHELRTPLTTIKGYAETILSQKTTPEQLSQFLQIIDREAERLARLVDALLDLSEVEGQKEQVRKQSVDLFSLIQGAAGDLEEMRRQKEVSLEYDLPGSPVFVAANPDWLRQALVNILENSIKYGYPGGMIAVAVQVDPEKAAVTISDNGPGIPPADLPYIFERFYRVEKARSRQKGGTGLGLAIVKHILEAHGAAYTVESAEGRGTTFRFTLPLVRPPDTV